MLAKDSLSEGHRHETRSQRGFSAAPLGQGAAKVPMTPEQYLDRVITQKAALFALCLKDGTGADTLAALRRSLNESKIKRALLRIREHWAAQIGEPWEPDDLSRRLDCIEYLLT